MQYEKAARIGVAIWDYDSNDKRVKVQESIVQQRVQEAERYRREDGRGGVEMTVGGIYANQGGHSCLD